MSSLERSKAHKITICETQQILKPECAIVHEARFTGCYGLQDFAATQEMGKFLFKHQLELLMCNKKTCIQGVYALSLENNIIIPFYKK